MSKHQNSVQYHGQNLTRVVLLSTLALLLAGCASTGQNQNANTVVATSEQQAPKKLGLGDLKAAIDRDYSGAGLSAKLYASLAPLARGFADRKRSIQEMTVLSEDIVIPVTPSSSKRPIATSKTQYIHGADGFTTELFNSESVKAGDNLFGKTQILTTSIGGIHRAKMGLGLYPVFSVPLTESMLNVTQGDLINPSGQLAYATQTNIAPAKNSPTSQGTYINSLQASPEGKATTNSCKVNETKLAASIHPKLEGQAIMITCTQTSISPKTKLSENAQHDYAYLEDYRWYFLQTITAPDGTVTHKTVKDVK